ncbi:MAG: hypothetical protein KAU99_03280 [Thermoplasmata archaeon]|nr:hypothetical protein [Thermoplasmata archaeon]
MKVIWIMALAFLLLVMPAALVHLHWGLNTSWHQFTHHVAVWLYSGARHIFDLILAATKWTLEPFGIDTPIAMAVAGVFFVIVAGLTIYALIWMGGRLYELTSSASAAT